MNKAANWNVPAGWWPAMMRAVTQTATSAVPASARRSGAYETSE